VDTAFLADPTPAAFAQAVLDAFADPVRADAIGTRARQLAELRYSDEAYMAKTRRACDLLIAAGGAPERGVA
jgi:hypothetical protein